MHLVNWKFNLLLFGGDGWKEILGFIKTNNMLFYNLQDMGLINLIKKYLLQLLIILCILDVKYTALHIIF